MVGDGFLKAVGRDPERVEIYDQPRGSPKDIGKKLSTVHSVVRTSLVPG